MKVSCPVHWRWLGSSRGLLDKDAALLSARRFNPAICGTESEDLYRLFALQGEFANIVTTIPDPYRGQSCNTSINCLRPFQDTRLSRDNVLAELGLFFVMIA
jgi:hypothetical protein